MSSVRVPRTPIHSVLTWYVPYLRGSRGLLVWGSVASAVTLACQVVIPLQVRTLLEQGIWQWAGVVLLVLLAVGALAFGHLTKGASYTAGIGVGTRIRVRMFAHLQRASNLHHDDLDRSAVVERHTSDVDQAISGLDVTLASGLPSVARLVLSLVLLTIVEWKAGVAMLVVTLGFLAIHEVVGRRLLVASRDRTEAASALGEVVDQAVTGAPTISGLRLERWTSTRFAQREKALRIALFEHASHLRQLFTGAQTAGMVGMVFVVIAALVAGGDELASVAAALLYVDGVVRSLEALPDWVRKAQLAAVAQRRIDQILADRPAQDPAPQSFDVARAILDDPALSQGSLVGLVTSSSLEPELILTILSAAGDPAALQVTVQGQLVRSPGISEATQHVPADPDAFNESIAAHLRASQPDWSDEQIRRALADVGIGYVAELPTGLHEQLGAMGAALTANEKERLALAIALAGEPKVLLVGPLMAFTDLDTAEPLLRTMRSANCEVVIASVHHPEVAAEMDRMLYVDDTSYLFGTHSDLLSTSEDYARIWEERLRSPEVDLSVLGLESSAERELFARLVTERFAPGEVIYREGDNADRIVFIISGHVEVRATLDGSAHRVAVLGPGNHCGDLRLTLGERRVETTVAMDDCVVRTLSREAIAIGMAAVIDRPVTDRRIVTAILRRGALSSPDLGRALTDVDPVLLAASLAALLSDGEVVDNDGMLTVAHHRSRKSGAADLLDRLDDV